MKEKLTSISKVPCELLDVHPCLLEEVIKKVTHNIVDALICELEKGESICSLTEPEQNQSREDFMVEVSRSIKIKRLVRCKDCKHRPTKTGVNNDIKFPDEVCPCQCDDDWYSWMPEDDWFCKDGERKMQNGQG